MSRTRRLPTGRRVMARPLNAGRPSRTPLVAALAVVAVAGSLALIAVGALPSLGEPAPSSSPSATPTFSAVAPNTLPATSPRPTPPATEPSVAPSPTASPRRAPPTPSASPTRDPAAAPRDAAEFDLEAQVIDIHFPLREASRYQYRDNWGEVREGEPEDYNHVHVGRRGRTAGRGHDGIDIYARGGEPVLAPFSGVVIDPTTRWQPWIRERYGRAAVIVSDESNSLGYAAFLSHLDRLWVEVGQRVRRGEVIGTVGNTGNAEGGPSHLHFELRAPFGLLWPDASGGRLVDAFNPYPSLVAADPKRTD